MQVAWENSVAAEAADAPLTGVGSVRAVRSSGASADPSTAIEPTVGGAWRGGGGR